MRIGFALLGSPTDLTPLLTRYFPSVMVKPIAATMELHGAVPLKLRLDIGNTVAYYVSGGRTGLLVLVYSSAGLVPNERADEMRGLAEALHVTVSDITDEQSVNSQIEHLLSNRPIDE